MILMNSMIIEITKEDNDIILNHLYKYNQGVDIPDKLAMDCYVKSIELKNDDIIFHTKRIKPILDKDCNITEDTVGSGIGDIGDDFSISLSDFVSPYGSIFKSAIREIKINKLIRDNNLEKL